MLEQLKAFEAKRPEIIFSWKDAETEAEGWAVINSLRGGAAGGGTRMRKGLDMHEVVSLAKTMEIKFSVAGPAIGGAKSGINFDPADPRKSGVIKRWYKALMPLLKNYYGTGGDLNIDEIHEVIPVTESYGLRHPQEGIVNGHICTEGPEKDSIIEQLRTGVSKRITDPEFTPDADKNILVADMITGYGVAEAVRHYYTLWGGNPAGKRAIVQGFGNVGGAAAWFLAKMGVKVVGIIDRTGGLFREEGLSAEAIRDLMLNRDGNALRAEGLIPFAEANEKVWSLGAEIFTPNAGSRLVTSAQLEQLQSNGLEVISCGANVPFADPEIFLGKTGIQADEICALLPDFIANCGMARVFAYLMQPHADLSDRAIFEDVSHTIYQGLEKIYNRNPSNRGITQAGFGIALETLNQTHTQPA